MGTHKLQPDQTEGLQEDIAINERTLTDSEREDAVAQIRNKLMEDASADLQKQCDKREQVCCAHRPLGTG